jgi:peptidoglycan hydrolase CwlO-like protein
MAPSATPRFLTRSTALLCAAVLVMVSLATAAAAADDAETPHPDPAAYRELAISLTRNTARVAPMAAQIVQITARIGEIDVQAATAEQQLATTRAEIERLRTIVRGRSAFIYSHAQAPSVILDTPHVEDIESGKQYAQSASVSDANRITDLDNSVDAIDSHLRDLQAARDDQAEQRDTIQRAKDALETLIVAQKKQLDAVSTITVMGTSELTGDQIRAWFESRGVRYQLSGGTTIGELADMFVEEGALEHVRGDIAFAQAVLEPARSPMRPTTTTAASVRVTVAPARSRS